MINPTTGSYIAKSYARDRELEAARDRRIALAKSAHKPDGARPARFTNAARLAALLVWPFRHEVATR